MVNVLSMTVKQKFVKFLRKNKIYEKFIGNLILSKKPYNTVNLFTCEPRHFISKNVCLFNEWLRYNKEWQSSINKYYSKLFIEFLVQNNVYLKFTHELRRSKHLSLERFLSFNMSPISYMSNAFVWGNSE